MNWQCLAPSKGACIGDALKAPLNSWHRVRVSIIVTTYFIVLLKQDNKKFLFYTHLLEKYNKFINSYRP